MLRLSFVCFCVCVWDFFDVSERELANTILIYSSDYDGLNSFHGNGLILLNSC